ncbi:hypothetical protein O6P43_000489 [Quillaja saponaria]|uniref:Uncharacterized protein n=1 Tax=Quillaja saponaria TaxID=32244 RepID=A0AAD7QH12_QUISA|nr:hypothetical protein O6P43_000489 [Quillaja saponaria]
MVDELDWIVIEGRWWWRIPICRKKARLLSLSLGWADRRPLSRWRAGVHVGVVGELAWLELKEVVPEGSYIMVELDKRITDLVVMDVSEFYVLVVKVEGMLVAVGVSELYILEMNLEGMLVAAGTSTKPYDVRQKPMVVNIILEVIYMTKQSVNVLVNLEIRMMAMETCEGSEGWM